MQKGKKQTDATDLLLLIFVVILLNFDIVLVVLDVFVVFFFALFLLSGNLGSELKLYAHYRVTLQLVDCMYFVDFGRIGEKSQRSS